MASLNVAEGKARFSELIGRAESGETVSITRRGKLVARIMPAEQPRKPIPVELLRELRASLPVQRQSVSDFMRELRDAERY